MGDLGLDPLPPHAFEGEKDHDDAKTHAREGQAKSEDVLERSAPRESSSKGKDLLYGLGFRDLELRIDGSGPILPLEFQSLGRWAT